MEPPIGERRQHQREQLHIQVTVRTDFASYTGTAFNLSAGGMSVLLAKNFAANDILKVSFELAGHTFSTDAVVVWASETHRAGLRFLNLSSEDREALAHWISEQNLKAFAAKRLF